MAKVIEFPNSYEEEYYDDDFEVNEYVVRSVLNNIIDGYVTYALNYIVREEDIIYDKMYNYTMNIFSNIHSEEVIEKFSSLINYYIAERYSQITGKTLDINFK